MEEAKKYLASNVLNEGRVVNYRMLSRHLKVHTNTAKQMLFAFYQSQNAKKAHAVHATYLLTGRKRPELLLNGGAVTQPNGTQSQSQKDAEGDSFMDVSPFPSSMIEPGPSQDEGNHAEAEHVRTTSIVLCKEEDLDVVRQQFEEITSTFVYSLQPGTIKDLHILSNCNLEVSRTYADEDPLEAWKHYGVIQNEYVKRRTSKRPPPPPAAIPTTAAAQTEPRPGNIAKEAVTELKKEATKSTTSTGSKPGPASKASLKRQSSDLFKSFAKSKPPKPKREDTQDSVDSAAAAEDSSMAGMSDDEGEEASEEITQEDKAKADKLRKQREQRQAQLKAMMDDDDEDDDDLMTDAPAKEAEAGIVEEEHAEDGAALDKKPQQEVEQKETVTVSGGRRRGRRRVMKKKTVQDEEGYLVTTEEPVWESFSEDEPEAKKQKLPPVSAPAQKAKKGGKGQGSITNFFAKR